MIRLTLGLLVTFTLTILWALCAAMVQPRATIPRIGVLTPGPPASSRAIDAFRQGLRDLGYVEGQTIRLEYRSADWQPDRLPALAAELVRLNPDVIFTPNRRSIGLSIGPGITVLEERESADNTRGVGGSWPPCSSGWWA